MRGVALRTQGSLVRRTQPNYSAAVQQDFVYLHVVASVAASHPISFSIFHDERLLAELLLLDAILQLGCDLSLTKRHKENLTICYSTVRLGTCADLRILLTA